MAAIITGRTSVSNIRIGRIAKVVSMVLPVLFLSVGCAQHYCPTYSSTSYNKSFNYSPEKYLTYRPVKVHEFKTVKANKSDKKEKSTKVR